MALSTFLVWIIVESVVRIILLGGALAFKFVRPHMSVHPVANFLYDYPYTPNETVTKGILIAATIVPYLFIAAHYFSITVARLKKNSFYARVAPSQNSSKEGKQAERGSFKNEFKWVVVQEQLRLFFSFTLAVGVMGVMVFMLKAAAGRRRPDFKQRCLAAQQDATVVIPSPDVLCPETSLVFDGYRSFPSGHAALSFTVASFVSFYLVQHGIKTLPHAYRSSVILLITALNLAASYCGVSRVTDFRHFYDDVIAGALIGVVISFAAYYYYYGSPFSSYLNTAFPYLPSPGDAQDSEVLLDSVASICPVKKKNASAFEPTLDSTPTTFKNEGVEVV